MELRAVRREEVADWLACMRVGFHSDPPDDPEEAAARFAERSDLTRAFAAFDRDRVVATYRSFATELTVPGGFVDACAVTNITVLPTHRRRGLLSTLLGGDLAAARERGEPVAILIASEWPIYGRFGFGAATEAVGLELRPRETRFVRPGDGEVELVGADDLVAAAPAVYEAHRRATPGAIARETRWWDVPAGLAHGWGEGPAGQRFALVRDDAGAVTGYARWHVKGAIEGHRAASTLTVSELFGTAPAAEARLWRLVGEVDLVTTVVVDQRGVDDLLPWLVADGRGVRQTWRADWMWLRVLDVPAALNARALGPGAVVVEVEDALNLAAGRFAVTDRGAEPTSAPADVTLPVSALSACYLGGRSLRTLAAAGWATEHRDGAVTELDRMLRSDVVPWCATMF